MQKSLYSERYGRVLDWLVEARKTAGLTQQQVADRLGRPQSFVAKYEHGERRLDIVELVDIAKILNVDPRQAIGLVD